MSYLDFYKDKFERIYVTEDVMDNPATQRLLDRLPDVKVKNIKNKEEIPESDRNQHTLVLNSTPASILNYCPGSKGQMCCNYLTIDLYAGCTLGCTYCIMKSYLNFSPIIVNLNITRTINEVIKLAKQNKEKTIRVGTGEVGDSLLYDPLFELSREFIEAFAPYPNIRFEMKSKTSFVDHLLNIPQKGGAVLGFSVNPQSIIDSEEGSAAPLSGRLEAAEKALAAGYKLAFHFDPIFYFPGWEEQYASVIKKLGRFNNEDLAWISMGTFRYPPALKERIEKRWYLYNEFVLGKDKKFRYIQKFRGEIYKHLYNQLKERFTNPPVYMCMESSVMWEKIFHEKPGKIKSLCTIFNKVELNKSSSQ